MSSTVAHVAAWEPYNPHDSRAGFLSLDLYHTDPAQHLITVDYLDDLDHDLSAM